MSVSRKPSAIIFGGLNTCSRALAALLVPLDGESLVSHLRIVDKFSVDPATTYIGAEFPKILGKPEVEYKQANLTVPVTVATCFDPPEGHESYDFVFDFTGEVRHDRTEVIQINTTCNVARLIGLEAAKRKVKAYIRVQQPFYDTSSSSKANHTEKEDIKPVDTLGTWWHETLRMLAAIEDLNLVILRIGFVYGPYTNYGIVASGITVASVYGYLKKPMKSMWSPGKNPNNTVHVEDVAGAAWACAQWMAPLGRTAANSTAGEEILFHNDKKKVKEVEGMPPHDAKLIVPLFNLVDDSNSTLVSIGQVVTSYFGTTFEFFNFVENTVLKLMDDHVEEINEHHVSGWTEMITTSNPPIPNTPLSAYMDKFALSKHVVAFNNTKIKEVIGYKLKRSHFDHEAIKEVVDKWKAEGSWPILPDTA
ncbi:putative NAD dependent epimerase dehydratase [Lyophyllum shimeji]|uniref:NAD dependent epimerase dehydratase n=1 Tax=Lyophyllum shimeji TaxID=47721 RepID=A0A9P3UL85_LYOSH|nr:putative NAD dependent epimerase dehydratase [Lyophyllum shimeji]